MSAPRTVPVRRLLGLVAVAGAALAVRRLAARSNTQVHRVNQP